jgi:geranylgeranyl reductase family protein
MLRTDVAVIGAGPAGVAAAITLARAGRGVVLVDKARFPRDKTCGDGLTAGALRRYEALGLEPSTVPSWTSVGDVMVRSPSGRTIDFPLPRGAGSYAVVAPRAELDAAFVDVARKAGVDVREDAALTSAAIGPHWASVDVDGVGTIAAHYVIGADGIWSPLRKAVGATDETGYLGEWHAFRHYVSGTGPAARDLWVWFDADLLPGYAWSFPLADGRANVGWGVPRRKGEKVRGIDLLKRSHIADVLGPSARAEGTAKAWPIPARVDETSLSAAGGRVLFVGDAARACDPMTGEGIGQALETGVLAAEAVLRAGPHSPGDAAAAYESAVQHGLAVDNRLAALLSRALAHRKGARAAVRVAGLTPWTRRNFARWLFEDYPRAALATPRRWRRHLLTGPGAYRNSG